MGMCALIDELSRLRKSSQESIDSEKSFSSFKQYMHIQRKIENELKTLLKRINSSGRKTLVLLCGSTGDGKSHILSLLLNYDKDNLLKDYIIYNDGTSSAGQTKHAIDSLNGFISEFADENIDKPGKNVFTKKGF